MTPTNEEIDKAIEATNYRYFGDYPLSEGQWDAVTTLILAARELQKMRKEAA